MIKKEIKDYIQSVENYLQERYGQVNDEWKAIIYLLHDNLLLYEECKQSIKDNGLYDKQSGRKNPLIATLKDLQATIMKQIQHLGISPYAASKIKQDENDDTDDFINNLING